MSTNGMEAAIKAIERVKADIGDFRKGVATIAADAAFQAWHEQCVKALRAGLPATRTELLEFGGLTFRTPEYVEPQNATVDEQCFQIALNTAEVVFERAHQKLMLAASPRTAIAINLDSETCAAIRAFAIRSFPDEWRHRLGGADVSLGGLVGDYEIARQILKEIVDSGELRRLGDLRDLRITGDSFKYHVFPKVELDQSYFVEFRRLLDKVLDCAAKDLPALRAMADLRRTTDILRELRTTVSREATREGRSTAASGSSAAATSLGEALKAADSSDPIDYLVAIRWSGDFWGYVKENAGPEVGALVFELARELERQGCGIDIAWEFASSFLYREGRGIE